MTSIDVCTSVLNPLNKQPDGTYTMNWPAGETTVASLQQDGTFATRPEGTAQRWEKAVLKGDRLIYTNIDGKVSKSVYYEVL